jgi:hypothetical protein
MNSYNNKVLTMFVVVTQTCSEDGIGLVVGSSYPIMVGPISCTKRTYMFTTLASLWLRTARKTEKGLSVIGSQ